MSIDKIEGHEPAAQSKDLLQDNIDKLKALFPEVVTEGKVDFEVLRDILGDEVETEDEYYRFTWAGKSQARREAHKPSRGTLRPAPEESVNWDHTQNLYLEGDNLEVLKLLQKSYAGKVKMIYIDPPYNTGKDFVYKDDYKDNLGNYKKLTGQVDAEGNSFTTNSDSDGRFHSNWLNMMYPRISLARNLLSNEGIMIISIDDNELYNQKNIMDELFGEENFIECFIWTSIFRPSNMSKKTRRNAEYILCYSKGEVSRDFVEREEFPKGEASLTQNNNKVRIIGFPANYVTTNLEDGIYKKGKYKELELHDDITVKNGFVQNYFRLSGCFKWQQDYLNEEIKKGVNLSIKGTNLIPYYRKDYQKTRLRPTKLIPKDLVDDVLRAGAEIRNLFGYSVFDYPKPTSLIEYFLRTFQIQDKDLVLDFFAGSAPAAEATMRYNVKYGLNVPHIQVQIPEKTEQQDHSSRFQNISDIGKERIRRAGQKIKQEKEAEWAEKEAALEKLQNKGELFEADEEKVKSLQEEITKLKKVLENLDIGFKVFKLDSSNIRAWDGNPENLEDHLLKAVTNLKEDRSEEDILYEILLKYGIDLTVVIEERELGGETVYSVSDGAIFICLGNKITTAVAEGIGAWKEELESERVRVVFKDSGLTDVAKTNATQILKRYGVEEVRSI